MLWAILIFGKRPVRVRPSFRVGDRGRRDCPVSARRRSRSAASKFPVHQPSATGTKRAWRTQIHRMLVKAIRSHFSIANRIHLGLKRQSPPRYWWNAKAWQPVHTRRNRVICPAPESFQLPRLERSKIALASSSTILPQSVEPMTRPPVTTRSLIPFLFPQSVEPGRCRGWAHNSCQPISEVTSR